MSYRGIREIAAEVSVGALEPRPIATLSKGDKRMTETIFTTGTPHFSISSKRLTRIVMRPGRSLSDALGLYTELSQDRGGVDLAVAIDGSDRASLQHRAGMPKQWFGYFLTMIGLCDGDTSLLENVAELFAGMDIEGAHPSMEAMLCAAEDFVILFERFPFANDTEEEAPF